VSTMVDACGVIAVLRGEPAEPAIRRLARKGPVWTTSVNLAEIVDRMIRLEGVDVDDITAEIRMLGIDVSPLPVDLAIEAGRCRADHYHRQRCPVSLADCVAAIAAREADSALATADRILGGLARTLGVEVVALPDSRGRRPAEHD
jgi:predicted nucleic acid-binding protein